MSHSDGRVWDTKGKIIGYFEYNGTCDICLPVIRKTQEEVVENWRGDQDFGKCKDCPTTIAIVNPSYGGGFYWKAKVCLEHMYIVGPLSPGEDAEAWQHFRTNCSYSKSFGYICGCTFMDGDPFEEKTND